MWLWRFKIYLCNLFLWRTQILTDLDEHKLGNANKSHISWSYLTTNLKTTKKITNLCSFSSKGSSVRMPSLQTWEGNCHQVATKCVRQALTMYTIVVENLVACFLNVEYELFLKSDHCICKDRIANVRNCTCTILSKCKGLPLCLWMKTQFFKRLPRKLLSLSFTWVLFYLLVTTIGANVDTDPHCPEIHPCRYFGKTL